MKGHAGIELNERVDVIANSFARGKNVELYKGEKKNYSLPETSEKEKRDTKSGAKRTGKAYSYVSKVAGVITRHATWEDCKRKVEGRTGAKFRKVLSKEEEDELIRSWDTSL